LSQLELLKGCTSRLADNWKFVSAMAVLHKVQSRPEAPTNRRHGMLLLGTLAMVIPSLTKFIPRHAFSATTGMNRKQLKSTLHTRGNLPPVVEVPREVPEEEPAAKEPLPERRVPYTMHIVSHFPNNKHLHEESNTRSYIERKIVDSFENFEDIIRHVEVNLQVSEGFHRDIARSKKAQVQVDDDVPTQTATTGRSLAPYICKVTISLKNHHTVMLSNPEKHAQPTLTESVDHMVDVLRNSLREEKERDIQGKRKTKFIATMEQSDEDLRAAMEADELAEELEQM